jgi:hypothetical protein
LERNKDFGLGHYGYNKKRWDFLKSISSGCGITNLEDQRININWAFAVS